MDKGVPMIVRTWKEIFRYCIILLTIFHDMFVLCHLFYKVIYTGALISYWTPSFFMNFLSGEGFRKVTTTYSSIEFQMTCLRVY